MLKKELLNPELNEKRFRIWVFFGKDSSYVIPE